jgi:hypothetical protein
MRVFIVVLVALLMFGCDSEKRNMISVHLNDCSILDGKSKYDKETEIFSCKWNNGDISAHINVFPNLMIHYKDKTSDLTKALDVCTSANGFTTYTYDDRTNILTCSWYDDQQMSFSAHIKNFPDTLKYRRTEKQYAD